MQIDVQYVPQIPENLSSNTIYVLTGLSQTITSPRNMERCSTIISTGGFVLSKSANINAILANNKNHIIIDNIDVNG